MFIEEITFIVSGPIGFIVSLPGPLVLLGDKNKGHPDEKDLENARAFAKGLLKA